MQNISEKQYIEKVYQLEKFLYEQKLLGQELLCEIKDVDNRPYKKTKDLQSKYNFTYGFDSDTFYTFMVISGVAFILMSVLMIVISGDVELRYIFAGRFWSAIFSSCFKGVLFGIGVFVLLSIIYFIFNIFKYFKNNNDIVQKNADIEKINKDIIQGNNQTYELRVILRNNLLKEHKFIYYNIKKTQDVLDKIYSLNIIYPKYRNLCAISSFYEYFQSGRCTTLAGHEGAYNIFENEIRLDRIVQQLDVVIEKLDQIKRNQYMLYNAIKQSQEISNNIIKEIQSTKNELKNIQSQNTHIIDNTRVTAYNAKITAQNTEFLKWYAIYS